MDSGHLGFTIKSGPTGAVSDPVGGLRAGTPGLTGGSPLRGPNAAPRHGEPPSELCWSPDRGAGGQARPQGGGRGGASGRGAPEGSPSAYTRISGRTRKLRADATGSEEAGDKALDQFW